VSDRPIFTYQTRPALDGAQTSALDAYAELYGKAERSLFAAIQAGGALNDLKRESFSALFGERLAGCSILTREYLSMVLGTVGVPRENARLMAPSIYRWAGLVAPSRSPPIKCPSF
jgi:hypothetical protein